jgi:hypothetical protein
MGLSAWSRPAVDSPTALVKGGPPGLLPADAPCRRGRQEAKGVAETMYNHRS